MNGRVLRYSLYSLLCGGLAAAAFLRDGPNVGGFLMLVSGMGSAFIAGRSWVD